MKENRTLKASRIVNASLDLVWTVWIESDHIKNWWGPVGFTNTIHHMEVKTQGKWKLTMHGPDGKDYENNYTFLEVVERQKIIYEHFGEPHFITTIIFNDLGNRTEIKWTMEFDSATVVEELIKAVNADKGLNQNLDKLEKYISNYHTK